MLDLDESRQQKSVQRLYTPHSRYFILLCPMTIQYSTVGGRVIYYISYLVNYCILHGIIKSSCNRSGSESQKLCFFSFS